MTNHLKFILCLSAAVSSTAIAQSPSTNPPASTVSASSPAVAYVYVSRIVSGGTEYEIEAFAAAPSGKLTAIAGSPFQEDVKNMAVNGKFLFATNHSGSRIETFRIEPGGGLRYTTTTQVANQSSSNTLGALFLDHTGASLYDAESNVGAYGNYAYQSFAVDKPVGDLKNVGDSGVNSWLNLPATLIGNNKYAYSASCLEDMYWGIFGFKRASSGALKDFDSQAMPPVATSSNFYCPSHTATDSSNHVAITMQAINQSDFSPVGTARLATYSANASGMLSTTSTRGNMPPTSVGTVQDLKMAPSGRLLAVGGSGGLQIFHFNGASPITHFTGLLTTDSIAQAFWDNQNHLYAITSKSNRLYVFTVTPLGYSEAPGSPYSIEKPQAIIVQPEPTL